MLADACIRVRRSRSPTAAAPTPTPARMTTFQMSGGPISWGGIASPMTTPSTVASRPGPKPPKAPATSTAGIAKE